MTWRSETLNDTFSGMIKTAQKKLDSLNAELSALSAQQARLASAITEADAVAALIDSISEDAATSGIYHLTLAPTQGSWESLILGAAGVPPRNASDYSAVIATLTVAADLSSVISAKDAMTSAANTVIDEVKGFFSVPVPSPAPASVPLPSIPTPSPKPENEWSAVTVGDVFPAIATESSNKIEKSLKAKQQAEDSMAEIAAKVSEVQAEVDELNSFLTSLGASGVYSFYVPPEEAPTQDWYTRLTATDDNKPPSQVTDNVAGTVTVIIAPSYPELLAKLEPFKEKLGI